MFRLLSLISSTFHAGEEYLTFDFDSRENKHGDQSHLQYVYKLLHPAYQEIIQDALDRFVDNGKHTLLLMGAAGSGTGWHRDWSEPQNFAFSISLNSSKGKPRGSDTSLALWIFVVIGKETIVEEWLVNLRPCSSNGLLHTWHNKANLVVPCWTTDIKIFACSVKRILHGGWK